MTKKLPSEDEIDSCTDKKQLDEWIKLFEKKIRPINKEISRLRDEKESPTHLLEVVKAVKKRVATELQAEQWYKSRSDWTGQGTFALVQDVGSKYVYFDEMYKDSRFPWCKDTVIVDIDDEQSIALIDPDERDEEVFSIRKRAFNVHCYTRYGSRKERRHRVGKKEFQEKWELYPNMTALIATDLIAARTLMYKEEVFSRKLCKIKGHWYWIRSLR